jgi:ornithine carbamoyltransferase
LVVIYVTFAFVCFCRFVGQDYAHPMQMLADLMVMMEHSGGAVDLSGKSLAFVGDIQVTWGHFLALA